MVFLVFVIRVKEVENFEAKLILRGQIVCFKIVILMVRLNGTTYCYVLGHELQLKKLFVCLDPFKNRLV